MKCLKCNHELLGAGALCPFCGTRIDYEAIRAKESAAQRKADKKTQRIQARKNAKQAVREKQLPEMLLPKAEEAAQGIAAEPDGMVEDLYPLRRIFVFPLLILLILLAGSVGFSEYQYKQNISLRTAVVEKDSAIADLQKELALEKGKLQQNTANPYPLAAYGKDIKDTLNNFNPDAGDPEYKGYYPDTSVVIVRVGETAHLTVYSTIYGTITFRGDNLYSEGEWGDWETHRTCDVKITGCEVGATTYTFTNDKNTHSFEVLAIVLPAE